MICIDKPELEYSITMAPRHPSYTSEFGKAIWEIIKKPYIPEKPIEGSPLSQQQHDALKAKWEATIKEKNQTGHRRGLSLDDFSRLLNQFYGRSVNDLILHKSSIHRLAQTGNTGIAQHARRLKVETLDLVSKFSNKYSFDYLLKLGDQVETDYQQARYSLEDRVRAVRPNTSESEYRNDTQPNLDDSEPLLYQEVPNRLEPATQKSDRQPITTFPKTNGFIQTTQPDIFKPVSEIAKSQQSLRNLVQRYIEQNGYEGLVSKGLSTHDILEIISKDDPRISIESALRLPSILGLSQEQFLALLNESSN